MTTSSEEQIKRRSHNHVEAFCLMHYACDKKCCHELIWNSRDGVTPFVVMSRRKHEMMHIEWETDRYAPLHKPCKGERIFVDATKSLLHQDAIDYVNRMWEHKQYPMQSAFASKEIAVVAILDSWCQVGSPLLIEVEESWE